MRLKILPTILCASIALTVSPLLAQVSNDPSDSFVTAYTAFDRAARIEKSGNTQAALATYRDVARLLDQISQRWPQWNPAIVEFRKKRTSEAIQKLQTQGGGRATNDAQVGAEGAGHGDPTPSIPASTLPLEPELPRNPADPRMSFVEPEPSLPAAEHSGALQAAPAANVDPITEIRNRMDQLTRDLQMRIREAEEVKKEKDELQRQFQESKGAREKAEQQQKVLQARADNAEAALMKALAEGAKESDTVKKLQAESAKAKKAVKDAQIEREAAEEVREQLASRLTNAQNKIAVLTKERDDAKKLSGDASKQIEEAERKMIAAIKEKDDLNNKLTKVTLERDDALAQVSKMKEAQKQVDKLVNDNTQLMAKLGDAEKQIAQFKAEGVEKDKVIADLKKEVGNVTQQLAEAQKQSQQYQVEMADLKSKLDTTSQQLAQMKADNTANVAEKKKMTEENDLLRGIVMRQMKEQARRDQTRKLVLDQMSKMEVKSKDLLNKIDYLGQPVVKLSAKERALFKKPQIEISNTEVSIAAVKQDEEAAPSSTELNSGAAPAPAEAGAPVDATAATTGEPATNPPAATVPEPAPAMPAASNQSVAELASVKSDIRLPKPNLANDDLPKKDAAEPSMAGMAMSGAGANVPADLMPLVKEAKENFERGNYRESEKSYEKILAKAPDNVYALSNLGVVRFRSGKLKLAEEAFKKAIAIAPEDGFSHCTLGIVYYSQNKFDEAMNSLTKALSINPKNATAHNYLGITASQKGWQENAMKELETATALDPNYADAHFNLAVVYATLQPANKEQARKYYKRATELGAEADTALEALLK